jgi:hypothetical protein
MGFNAVVPNFSGTNSQHLPAMFDSASICLPAAIGFHFFFCALWLGICPRMTIVVVVARFK